MKIRFGNDVVTAILLIVIGALFMIYKSAIIGFAINLIGITLIVLGILDIIRKSTASGVVKTVFGVLVMTVGNLVIEIALYVIGAFLLIAGILELVRFSKLNIKKYTLPVIMHVIQPIIYILVAVCLFFNQGGAISWVFTVSGLFLILDGVVGLIGALDR